MGAVLSPYPHSGEKRRFFGLDKSGDMVRINRSSFYMQPVQPAACEHSRTVIIARRDGVDYVECLDCRLIIEAEDLEPVVIDDDEE
jgi:Zn ribbon nucleic-acid-binding protein